MVDFGYSGTMVMPVYEEFVKWQGDKQNNACGVQDCWKNKCWKSWTGRWLWRGGRGGIGVEEGLVEEGFKKPVV